MTALNLADFSNFKTVMDKVITQTADFESKYPKVNLHKMEAAALKRRYDELEIEVNQANLDKHLADQIAKLEEATTSEERASLQADITERLKNRTLDEFMAGLTPAEKKAQLDRDIADTRAERQKVHSQRQLHLKKADSYKFQKFKDKHAQVKALYDGLGSNPSEAQKQNLYNSLKELSDAMPGGIMRDTLESMYINAMAAKYDVESKRLRADMEAKMKPTLTQNGNSGELKFGLSTKVGFGILAATASVEATSDLTFNYSVGDNGQITVTNTAASAVKASGEGSVGLAKMTGSLKASVSHATAETYNNVNDFFQAQDNRLGRFLTEATLGKTGSTLKALKHAYKEGKGVDLIASARAQQHRLESHGKMFGFLDGNATVAVPEGQKVDSFSTETETFGLNAEFSAKVSLSEIGGRALDFSAGLTAAVDISKVKETKTRTVNFVEHMLKHPAIQDIYADANPKFFYIYERDDNDEPRELSGAKALEEIQDMLRIATMGQTQLNEIAAEQGVAIEASLAQLRARAAKMIQTLRTEYQAISHMERWSHDPKYKNMLKKSLGDVRKLRDAHNSAAHLKALSSQYVLLRRAYEAAIPPGKSNDDIDPDFAKELRDFEEQLSHPTHLSEDEVNKEFTVNEFTFSEKNKYKSSVAGNLSLTYGGVNVAAKVSIEHSGKLLSEPEKGKLLHLVDPEVKLKVEASGKIPLKDVIKKAVTKAKTETTDLQADSSLNEAETSAEIDQAIIDEMDLIPEGDVNAKAVVEVSFYKKEGKWRLKLVRLSSETGSGMGFGVPIKTVGPSLTIKATQSQKVVTNRTQYLGNQTLGILPDTFERYKLRGKMEDWGRFKLQHDGQLRTMFNNLKDANSGISKEMSKTVDDLGDDAAKTAWNTVLSTWRSGGNTYQTVMGEFEKIMEKKAQKNYDERYKKFQTRVATGSLEQYVAKTTSDALEEFSRKYAIDSPASVADMLAKARAKYKLGPGQGNFKMLQHAYALENAYLELMDNLNSDDINTKMGKTVKLLEGNVFAKAMDDPKVYIRKGISAKLVPDQRGTVFRVDAQIVADNDAIGPKDVFAALENKMPDVPNLVTTSVKRKEKDNSLRDYYSKTPTNLVAKMHKNIAKRFDAKKMERMVKLVMDEMARRRRRKHAHAR